MLVNPMKEIAVCKNCGFSIGKHSMDTARCPNSRGPSRWLETQFVRFVVHPDLRTEEEEVLLGRVFLVTEDQLEEFYCAGESSALSKIAGAGFNPDSCFTEMIERLVATGRERV